MANVYSFSADDKTIAKIVNSFEQQYFKKAPQYADYLISYDDCNITIYTSKKVVFQGKNANIYAATFFETEKKVILPQAGSDEVGTGDYFGPICVCCTYIDEDVYKKIADLKIIDSKQLTDKDILKIAPILIENVPHSLMVLDNERFNEVNKQYNMNEIKAQMHNKGYLNLINKGIKLPSLIVIDDFCGEGIYYHYLRKQPEVIHNIVFETKAENKYVSVAAGAIISRYALLKWYEKLNKKYQLNFPKGAGNIVDEFGKEFVAKYGIDEFKKLVKLNFKNTQKILNN